MHPLSNFAGLGATLIAVGGLAWAAALSGHVAGRRSSSEVTAYKSFGSVIQDLRSGWHVYQALQ